ncbi:hypothetical protein G7Y79_00067g095430 [Physcia stellaris]|nr:hypothetical protein G7Y79_00067g095430 [Physcia stellaris]
MESTKQIKRRGLTEVHRPATGTPLIDVVFVHGLDGHPRSTWMSEKDKVFWPSQLLPPILEEEKARILVYGYDADVTPSRNGPATMSRDKIHNHGEQLVAELCGNRSKPAAERPIIFVAHSLGGLVVKSALIHSSETRGTKTRRLRSIFVSTYGILFLGTPHKGFDIRKWISRKELASGARVHDKRIRTQSHVIDALQSNSETLQVLDRRFIDLTDRFQIFLFHEGKPTRMNGKLYYVIHEESAAPTIQDVEHAVIQQDHAHMCQFDNDHSPGFALVTEALQRYAAAAPESIQAAWGLEHKEHHVKIEAEVQQKLSSISISDYQTSPDTGSQRERHYIVPRTQVKNFIGREAQLSQISSHFLNDRVDNQPQILVLHALGGQGKSQLVLKYCSSSREIYAGIFWINASSEQLAMQSFAQIGTALGIASSAITERNDLMVKMIKQHLECWSQRWLLVFDNYDEPQKFSKVRQFIPQCKCSAAFSVMSTVSLLIVLTVKKGRVIFTSRNAQLDRLGHYLMEVPAMNAKEGVGLLLSQHSHEDIEHYFTQASSIVERLGGLPLAIEQAAAYIRYRRLPLQRLDNFVEVYETKRRNILSHTPAHFWEYTTSQIHGEEDQAKAISAFTTWEMSLEQLPSMNNSSDYQEKIHLLTLSAFFNPTKIEEFLFRNHWEENSRTTSWLRNISTNEETNRVSEEETSEQDSSNRELDTLWDSEKYLDLLLTFYELSLLQSLERDAGEVVFSLHPLIRDWLQLRAEMKKRQACIEESMEVVAASVKVNYGKVMSFEYDSALLAHIDTCLANDERFSKKQHQLGNRIKNCDIACWLAKFCHDQGRYQVAEKLFRQMVATDQNVLGLEHEDTMRAMDSLAQAFLEQGKFDEAETSFLRTLQLRQKLFGERNADTIQSLQNLASLSYRKGKYDDAEMRFGQVLQWRTTELGHEDPRTLSTMRELGWVVREQGRYEEAETIQRQTLCMTEQAQGIEHGEYVNSMSSLASILDDQHKSEEAEQLQRQVLYLREKSWGKRHPDTLASMNNLALTLEKMGKLEEAEQMNRAALQLKQEVLGNKHPDTLTSMNNLAELLHSQGNYEAEHLLRETLRLRHKVLGKKHPDTLITMHYLASRLPEDEAEPLFRETLRLRVEVLGKKHADTLITVEWLAWVLRKQRKNDEAEEMMKDLAVVLREQGRNDEAIEIEQRHREFQQLNHGHSDCQKDAGQSSRG